MLTTNNYCRWTPLKFHLGSGFQTYAFFKIKILDPRGLTGSGGRTFLKIPAICTVNRANTTRHDTKLVIVADKPSNFNISFNAYAKNIRIAACLSKSDHSTSWQISSDHCADFKQHERRWSVQESSTPSCQIFHHRCHQYHPQDLISSANNSFCIQELLVEISDIWTCHFHWIMTPQDWTAYLQKVITTIQSQLQSFSILDARSATWLTIENPRRPRTSCHA